MLENNPMAHLPLWLSRGQAHCIQLAGVNQLCFAAWRQVGREGADGKTCHSGGTAEGLRRGTVMPGAEQQGGAGKAKNRRVELAEA